MQMTMWIVLCQEIVRDGRSGEYTVGGLVGIRSDCEVLEYASLDEAAADLAVTTMEVRLNIPGDAEWRAWREMPALMKEKFRHLYGAKRKAFLGKSVPIGMLMAKVKTERDSESGWAILFVARLPDGEYLAPDLDGLADIVAPLDLELARMPEGRAEGVYNLPEGWRTVLDRLIEVRRIATAAVERARR